MPAIEETPTMRPLSAIEALVEQLAADLLRGGEVDRDHRAPAVLLHVRQLLVAGDAGVVHDGVDLAVLLLDVLGDPLRRVLGGDVERQVVAAELVHQRLQLARGLRYVDAEDRRAVAVQHLGDLLADAARGAGDDRDLAGERLRGVGDRGGLVGAGGAETGDLAGDVGALRREEEGEGGLERLLGTRRDVHQVDGAALADLLAERAGEALERALGDALLVAVGLLGDGAEHHDPRTAR